MRLAATVDHSSHVLYERCTHNKYSGADPDFNKGGCLMRRAAQWQSHCHSCFAAVGVGCPLQRKARKLEHLGYSVIQKYCKIQ